MASPNNEADRLAALHRLNVLDTEPEAAFDRIAEVAQQAFGVQGAAVSLVDEERQWFKATCGLSLDETPREKSFCTHVIQGDDVMVVEDAKTDPRFRENALIEEEGIRFYAGAPLTMDGGLHVGTLCLTNPKPRSFGTEDRTLLAQLAGVATDLLEARRESYQVRYLTSVVEQIDESVLVTEGAPLDPPGPKITWVNEALMEMTGYDRDELLGSTPRMLQGPETDRETLDRVRDTLEAEEPVEAETINYRKDGTPYVLAWTITPVRDQDGTLTHWASVQRDVTQQREQVEELRHQARHDPLTGALERPALEKHIQDALNADASPQGAVLFLDLDRFKHVNDTLGHRAGDHLLAHVADQLRAAVRVDDKVARIGGDEFAVWLPSVENEAAAIEVAHRILDAIREPVEVVDENMRLEASLGLVADMTGYASAEDVIGDADVAMYQSKQSAADSITVHEPAMTTEAKKHLRRETALRRAVEQENFEPYFLPTVRLHTGTLVGFEVLARWRQPDGSIALPRTFLRPAEETNLIAPISRQVIEKAFQALYRLPGSPNSHWKIRLNGNFPQRELFQEDTRVFLADILDRHDVPPDRFTVEVTERTLADGEQANLAAVQKLRDLGVRIEVDDFGTGYSSHRTLIDFPLDGLKIDRGLLIDVPDDAQAASVVRSVLEMGRRLDLTVTAEGIETTAQLETLRELDCPLGQGFLFSRPVPAEDLPSLIDAPPWADLWDDRPSTPDG